MEPGKEFDALIAKKVMGIKGPYMCDCEKTVEGYSVHLYDAMSGRCLGCNAVHELKRYSTGPTAAWQVVEKMKSERYNYAVKIRGYHHGYGEYMERYGEYMESYAVRFEKHTASGKGRFQRGDTLPEVICLAALKAVGVKV